MSNVEILRAVCAFVWAGRALTSRCEQPKDARTLFAQGRGVVAAAVRAFLALYREDGPKSASAPGHHEASAAPPEKADQWDEQAPEKFSDAKCLSILFQLLPSLRQQYPERFSTGEKAGQPGGRESPPKRIVGADGELRPQFERLDETSRLAQMSDHVADWGSACMALADYLWSACWNGQGPPLAWNGGLPGVYTIALDGRKTLAVILPSGELGLFPVDKGQVSASAGQLRAKLSGSGGPELEMFVTKAAVALAELPPAATGETSPQSCERPQAAVGPDKPQTSPRLDGPEPPCWFWWNGKRFRIGEGKSRRSWELLHCMWGRESLTFQELRGTGRPWEENVGDSVFATAANRVNNCLPSEFPRRLGTHNYCVVWKTLPENHGESPQVIHR